MDTLNVSVPASECMQCRELKLERTKLLGQAQAMMEVIHQTASLPRQLEEARTLLRRREEELLELTRKYASTEKDLNLIQPQIENQKQLIEKLTRENQLLAATASSSSSSSSDDALALEREKISHMRTKEILSKKNADLASMEKQLADQKRLLSTSSTKAASQEKLIAQLRAQHHDSDALLKRIAVLEEELRKQKLQAKAPPLQLASTQPNPESQPKALSISATGTTATLKPSSSSSRAKSATAKRRSASTPSTASSTTKSNASPSQLSAPVNAGADREAVEPLASIPPETRSPSQARPEDDLSDDMMQFLTAFEEELIATAPPSPRRTPAPAPGSPASAEPVSVPSSAAPHQNNRDHGQHREQIGNSQNQNQGLDQEIQANLQSHFHGDANIPDHMSATRLSIARDDRPSRYATSSRSKSTKLKGRSARLEDEDDRSADERSRPGLLKRSFDAMASTSNRTPPPAVRSASHQAASRRPSHTTPRLRSDTNLEPPAKRSRSDLQYSVEDISAALIAALGDATTASRQLDFVVSTVAQTGFTHVCEGVLRAACGLADIKWLRHSLARWLVLVVRSHHRTQRTLTPTSRHGLSAPAPHSPLLARFGISVHDAAASLQRMHSVVTATIVPTLRGQRSATSSHTRYLCTSIYAHILALWFVDTSEDKQKGSNSPRDSEAPGKASARERSPDLNHLAAASLKQILVDLLRIRPVRWFDCASEIVSLHPNLLVTAPSSITGISFLHVLYQSASSSSMAAASSSFANTKEYGALKDTLLRCRRAATFSSLQVPDLTTEQFLSSIAEQIQHFVASSQSTTANSVPECIFDAICAATLLLPEVAETQRSQFTHFVSQLPVRVWPQPRKEFTSILRSWGYTLPETPS